jgi:heterodisulfide reductase subunit A-like polyferredoxin
MIESSQKTGSVMVVGGGIAGIQASLDLEKCTGYGSLRREESLP